MEDATTTIQTVIEGIPRDALVIVPEAAAAAIWRMTEGPSSGGARY